MLLSHGFHAALGKRFQYGGTKFASRSELLQEDLRQRLFYRIWLLRV